MRKIISIVLSFGLLFQQSGLVYAVGELNLANYLSQARSAIVQPDQFRPAQLRYISYDIKSNDFKLLLDKGDVFNQKTEKPKNPALPAGRQKTLELLNSPNSPNSQTPKLNDATQELFNYFLIGLSLPNDTFWVNLRPDAPDNIIDPLLEKTDIGKIFLEADLQLKKDTASFTSPQNPEGKAYWDKLYKKAGELFGTENITIPTITRPWIVPNEVIVRETEDSAYIYKATLKVMLESDYLIGRGGSRTAPTPDQYVFSDPRLKELNEYSTQLIRETIIPKLTKEINSSKRYAQLRQVYYSLVLARWFKQKYSSLGSAGASANSYLSLIDSGNLVNLASKEPCDKQSYFQAYKRSFKDGEYNLKETVATPFGQSIRSYISGGLGMGFEYEAVNSPVTGIRVNSSPVTNILIEHPPATTGSPISAQEFIDTVDIIYKSAVFSPNKISYEDAFYKIIELVPLLKEGEKIPSSEITDMVFKIIHEFGRSFLDKSLLEMVIGKRKYTRDSFLSMVLQEVQKAKVLNEGLLKDDITSAISNLAVMPGKSFSKYKKDIENIKKGNNYFDNVKKLNKIRDYILGKDKGIFAGYWFDRFLALANERLPLITKYNNFLKVVEKARKKIAAGSPLTLKQGQGLFLGLINEINSILKPQGMSYLGVDEKITLAKNLESLLELIPGVSIQLDSFIDNASDNAKIGLQEIREKFKNFIKLVSTSGSPLKSNKSADYVDEARVKLTNFHQWDTKKSSDATLDDLIEAAKKAGESKLKPNAMEATPEAVEWYGLAEKLAEIKSEWSVYAGSPVTLEKARKQWEKHVNQMGSFRVDKIRDSMKEKRLLDYKKSGDVLSFVFELYGDSVWTQTKFDVQSIADLDITLTQNYLIKLFQDEFYTIIPGLPETVGMIKIYSHHKFLGHVLYKTILILNKEYNKAIKNPSSISHIRFSKDYDYDDYIEKLFDGMVKLGALFAEMRRKFIVMNRTDSVYEAEDSNDGRIKFFNVDRKGRSVAVYGHPEGMLINEFSAIKYILQDKINPSMAEEEIEKYRKFFSVSAGSPLTLEEVARKLNSFFKEDNLYPRIISSTRDMAAYYAAAYGNLNPKDKDKILEAAKVAAGLLKEIGNPDAKEAKIYEELVVSLSDGFTDFLKHKEGSTVPSDSFSVRGQSEDPVMLGVGSSSLQTIQKPTNPLGGIDLTDRMLNIKLERVGSFALSVLVLPEIANVEVLDLDKEFEQIQAMVSSSIRPSDTRILEFAAACYYRGEFDRRLTQVSSCVKAAHLADERLGRESSPDLRLATMLPDALYGG